MSALTDQRPWGHYTVLADEEDHKVKRIVVQPGKRLSYSGISTVQSTGMSSREKHA